jgi:mono/diheme cytochrome c family protein
MVWQTPAVDPKHGLIYFSTGNAGPDFNGSLRQGDNLFSVSLVAIDAKTGKSAGNNFAGSPAGDSLWLFSLAGILPPSEPPQALAAKASAVAFRGGDVVAGAAVYAQVCAPCHGEEGKGGHGGGPNITNVTAPELVGNTVVSGKNNMPPFAATLTFAQIGDVAEYVATKLGK